MPENPYYFCHLAALVGGGRILFRSKRLPLYGYFDTSWIVTIKKFYRTHYAWCIRIFRAPLDPGPGTMYRCTPLNSPLVDRGRETQLLSKKYRGGSELLATLCPIWPAWDFSLKPPTQRRTCYRPTNWPKVIMWQFFGETQHGYRTNVHCSVLQKANLLNNIIFLDKIKILCAVFLL